MTQHRTGKSIPDDAPVPHYRQGCKVDLDAIPIELRELPRWLCWQQATREGRLTKIPKDPRHPTRNAAVDDPSTWGTFEQAVKTYERGRITGIGLVLVADDDLLVFDLDHCRDTQTGVIEEWAKGIVAKLDSYTEISPSGTGIHIFVRGKLPGKRRRKGQVEVYESGRYMTVTGWVLGDGRAVKIAERQAEIDAVYREFIEPQPAKAATERKLPRRTGLSHSQKMTLLEAGDWQAAGYPSASEADLDYFRHLLAQSGGDAQKADEKFRLSALMRDKWDERHSADGDTYGQMTMRKAAEPLADGKRGKTTQADILLRLAEDLLLVHTSTGESYAIVTKDGVRQVLSLESGDFRLHLVHQYYLDQNGRAPSESALKTATETLRAKARIEGEEAQVHLRVAEYQGKIYYNLSNDKWEVVEIRARGWKVLTDPPVLFTRTAGMLALPHPEPGGSIELLRPLLNMAEDELWTQYVAWLIGCLNPVGPYPVLILQGEQGSAKSTAARVAKALLDPDASPLRTPPGNDRDLIIAATHTWMLAYDNLSGLDRQLGDAICRLATGGGNRFRKLYTDSDEKVFRATRPVIINGIEDLTSREDLASRAVVLHLPAIPGGKRKREAELWEEFERVRPQVLGALFDAVSAALASRKKKMPVDLPRMADFAWWVVRAERALPWEDGRFITVYAHGLENVAAETLANDAVAATIREMLRSEGTILKEPNELLESLNNYASLSPHVQREAGWPRSPRALSNRLTRLAPHFRTAGIVVERRKVGGRRLIEIRAQGTQGTQDSKTSGEMPKRRRVRRVL